VKLPAVGLDDQALCAPEEVDFVGTEAGVYLGQRQLVRAQQAQEGALEIASGALLCPAHVSENSSLGGDRDVLAARDVDGTERRRAMKDDALPAGPAAVAGDRDVGPRRAPRGKGPELGG
jgi:hypothetical protein